MARDRITRSTQDLTSDPGSVLVSVVMGEQFEFAVTLDMVAVANSSYTYEAALIEAANDGKGTKPKIVEPGGIGSSLPIRLCTYLGDWNATTGYDAEDVVDYDGRSYRLTSGTNRVDATKPDVDDAWTIHDKRTLYVQFASTLGTTYAVQPTADIPTYAFFELRVTEQNDPIYNTTWKPVRGLVEFLFSPTHLY